MDSFEPLTTCIHNCWCKTSECSRIRLNSSLGADVEAEDDTPTAVERGTQHQMRIIRHVSKNTDTRVHTYII